MQLDGMIGQATSDQRSLDDLVMELYRQTAESYEAKIRGDLIIPSRDGLGRYELRLVEKNWYRIELGFHPKSMRLFRFQGLVAG